MNGLTMTVEELLRFKAAMHIGLPEEEHLRQCCDCGEYEPEDDLYELRGRLYCDRCIGAACIKEASGRDFEEYCRENKAGFFRWLFSISEDVFQAINEGQFDRSAYRQFCHDDQDDFGQWYMARLRIRRNRHV